MMSTFMIVLLWILSLLVLWTYRSVRCGYAEMDSNWNRERYAEANENRNVWFAKATTLEKLLREARTEAEALDTEVQRQARVIATQSGANDRLQDRLASAEMILTGNLAKSFRSRLPWPTAIERAFAGDEGE